MSVLGGNFSFPKSHLDSHFLDSYQILSRDPRIKNAVEFFGEGWKSHEKQDICSQPLCYQESTSDALIRTKFVKEHVHTCLNVALLSHKEFPRICDSTPSAGEETGFGEENIIVLHCYTKKTGSSKISSLKEFGSWYLS